MGKSDDKTEGRIPAIPYKEVNVEATGRYLRNLRQHNDKLRRYICSQVHYLEANCSGNCNGCDVIVELDDRITQAELAEAFGASASKVASWESGRTLPSIGDLLFYSEICGIDIKDILRFK